MTICFHRKVLQRLPHLAGAVSSVQNIPGLLGCRPNLPLDQAMKALKILAADQPTYRQMLQNGNPLKT